MYKFIFLVLFGFFGVLFYYYIMGVFNSMLINVVGYFCGLFCIKVSEEFWKLFLWYKFFWRFGIRFFSYIFIIFSVYFEI